MKWFFGVVVLLNLCVGLWSVLKTRPQMDIHAQEVSPRSIRLLPADWGEGTLAPRSDTASAAMSVKPEPGPTKLVANLDPSTSSALLNQPAPAKPEPAAAPSKAAASQPAAKAEPKPVAAKAEPKLAQQDACFNWGELDAKTLGRVKPELAQLKVKASERVRQAGGGKFWVYMPVKPGAEQSQKISAELKTKGFDNYPAQHEGELKGALSLGLFAKEDGAQALLDKLKSAGFAEARINQRGGALTSLSFSGLNAQQVQALTTLQRRQAPGIALKSVSCS